MTCSALLVERAYAAVSITVGEGGQFALGGPTGGTGEPARRGPQPPAPPPKLDMPGATNDRPGKDSSLFDFLRHRDKATSDPDELIERLQNRRHGLAALGRSMETAADTAYGLTPGGGIYEAIAGASASGRNLSNFERGFAVVGTLGGSAAVVGKLDDLFHGARTVSRVYGKSGEAVSGLKRPNVDVIYDNIYNWKGSTNASGYYDPRTGEIHVLEWLADNELTQTIRHEYMHKILHEKLPVNLYGISHAWRFLEEAIAEGYATRSLWKGLDFPIQKEYVSVPKLGAEFGGLAAVPAYCILNNND